MAPETSIHHPDLNQENELVRLAEADGATFVRTPTGSWWVRDSDGMIIARGCLSKAEAAAHYCKTRT